MTCQFSHTRSLYIPLAATQAITLIVAVTPIAAVAMRHAIHPGCLHNLRHGGRGLVSRNSTQASVQVARFGTAAMEPSSAVTSAMNRIDHPPC